ncbi:hypothetical protein [Streptomyces antarcticus]|uniref:hypothetical protein n=1 Tax=Streptomyces antarcticus TaxID=2996458 RepID=UPI0022710B7B|nr:MULTISPECIES: hypothetical protein [unclassified Streptomyces]MCY0943611.1 hypothetical protein [Streptomyces sp. H34-AA3]MCZ4086041.1 hypothetical protein [Streptomyces sp. H34-S5]
MKTSPNTLRHNDSQITRHIRGPVTSGGRLRGHGQAGPLQRKAEEDKTRKAAKKAKQAEKAKAKGKKKGKAEKAAKKG